MDIKNQARVDQANRWLANEDLMRFCQQASIDMYVGLKNGVSRKEINKTLRLFMRTLQDRLKCPEVVTAKNKEKVLKNIKPYLLPKPQ